MAYDSNATREKILVAAGQEFAALGFAGARVDRIVAEAGVNKRAVYDYFGDKHGLFAAVLDRQLSECAESVAMDGDDLPKYAEALMDYHAQHPEALRLLLWEALEFGDAQVPAEEVRTGKYHRRVQTVAATEAYPEDARVLVFFTMGLVNWIAAVPQLRRMILGDEYDRDRLRRVVSAAVGALATMSSDDFGAIPVILPQPLDPLLAAELSDGQHQASSPAS
jgi:AcrR family transcriptional regulator